MKFGSLFSGVGGMDLGMERAGWECAWQVEKEPYRRAVLKTHWPEVPKYEDVKTVGGGSLSTVDLVAAGVPCQDVSIAGKRRGLAGARTGLFFEFARILKELRPAWFLFENVPGLLSSNKGRDFSVCLQILMGRCGYGVAWRCLNSRFFGVAQNRSRLFVVGSLGRPCPAEVLFEPPGGGRDIEAVDPEGSEVSRALAASSVSSGYRFDANGEDFVVNSIIPGTGRVGSRGADDGANIVAHSLTASNGHHGHSSPRGDGSDNLVAATLTAGSHPNSNAAGRRREDDENLVPTLLASGAGTARPGGPKIGVETDISSPTPSDGTPEASDKAITPLTPSLETCETDPKAREAMSVRRLMPTECEALQGFPRGWTVPATEHWATRLQSRSRSGSDVES